MLEEEHQSGRQHPPEQIVISNFASNHNDRRDQQDQTVGEEEPQALETQGNEIESVRDQ